MKKIILLSFLITSTITHADELISIGKDIFYNKSPCVIFLMLQMEVK